MLKNVLILTLVATLAMVSVGAAQEAGQAEAQESPEEQAALPDVTTPLGLFVYPANEQDAYQQSMDELECYAWAEEQAAQAGAAQAEADAAEQLDTFKRAMSVCLEGRSYSVK